MKNFAALKLRLFCKFGFLVCWVMCKQWFWWWIRRKFEAMSDFIAISKVCNFGFSFELCLLTSSRWFVNNCCIEITRLFSELGFFFLGFLFCWVLSKQWFWWWICRKVDTLSDSIAICKVCTFGFSLEFRLPLVYFWVILSAGLLECVSATMSIYLQELLFWLYYIWGIRLVDYLIIQFYFVTVCFGGIEKWPIFIDNVIVCYFCCCCCTVLSCWRIQNIIGKREKLNFVWWVINSGGGDKW